MRDSKWPVGVNGIVSIVVDQQDDQIAAIETQEAMSSLVTFAHGRKPLWLFNNSHGKFSENGGFNGKIII